jgi:hypothetical protein
MDAARLLLTRAIEEGGPTDIALAFLQRLNRFDAAADRAQSATSRAGVSRPPAVVPGTETRWLRTILVSAAIATSLLLLTFPVASWIAELPLAPSRIEAVRPEPLPVVRTSEMLLARARGLYLAGKLKDALAQLDRIGTSDPVRADADRLRANVQRDLLAAAGLSLADQKGVAR